MYVGNLNPNVPPLPGDVARFPDQSLRRFELESGWVQHDRFQGEFEEGRIYNAGDVVTRGGAVWIAQSDDVWECLAGNAPEGA